MLNVDSDRYVFMWRLDEHNSPHVCIHAAWRGSNSIGPRLLFGWVYHIYIYKLIS